MITRFHFFYTDSMYIDCHNHLADQQFQSDISQVIDSAKHKGVLAALVCSETSRDFDRVLELSKSFPDFILPCLGIHPVQCDKEGKEVSAVLSDIEDALPYIKEHINKLGAIGEIGLDFQPRIAPTAEARDIQREVLKIQVNLAKAYGLPVNVHSRSAGKPTIALLKELGAEKVLLHAFDGRPSIAMEGVKEGYFFSIPPSIVRSEQKMKLVKQMPMDNILLETDSPALGPDKMERNVPGNICLSCESIAQIKNLDVNEVKVITFNNAIKLFPKLKQLVKAI